MRKLWAFILFIFAASFALGQGSFIPPQTAFKVVNGFTTPIAGATITVCGPNASGIPCSPALVGAIFSNSGLTQALSNPFTADAQGNYQFAAASGTYTVTVTAAGFTGNSYQVSNGSSFSSANLSTYGRFVTVYSDGGANIQTTGSSTESANVTSAGGQTGVPPTAIDNWGDTLSSTAAASLNTVAGIWQGTGGNFGLYGFGAFTRWSFRFQPVQTANVRYWMGITTWLNGGPGSETQLPLGTAKFATDVPNSTTLAFRYSAGVDTTWKCTSQITSGSQTVSSTGVALDVTAPHLFEITYDGTTESCYIDGALTTTITTNVPSTTAFHAAQFWSADNKNTANAVSGTHYWMALALK